MMSQDKIKGLLSVVIPTFGRGVDVVSRAVRSVQEQTFKPIEVLVVDDNPTGNSLGVAIASYCQHEEDVRYIKTRGAAGACVARNVGIVEARGQWIGFLDDDDTWEPNKAALQIAQFASDVGMVFCRGLQIDETVQPPARQPYYADALFKPEMTFEQLLIMDRIGTTSQAIVSRDCFDQCGLFDEALVARQDYDMWLRISRTFRVVGVDATLFRRYIHEGDQISKSSRRRLNGYRQLFAKYETEVRACREAHVTFLTHLWENAADDGEIFASIGYLSRLACLSPARAGRSLLNRSKRVAKRMLSGVYLR